MSEEEASRTLALMAEAACWRKKWRRSCHEAHRRIPRPDLAATIAEAIRREADPARTYNIMEFCGGHTHAIFRYGVQDLMPSNVHFIHVPAALCVLPVNRLDDAVELAEKHCVILCSYAT